MTNEQEQRAKKQRVRVNEPERSQVGIQMVDLDSLIECDHPVRAVWSYVETLDLSPFYDRIKALPGEAGRTPISPKLLVALWLWASLRGVGSARLVAKLCDESIPYRWLCGGVSVNYHTLADFRVNADELLHSLMVDSIASMRDAKLVTMDRITIDGTKIRASAGAKSFRRRERLDQMRVETEETLKQLRRELNDDPSASVNREKKREQKAAEEKLRKLEKARETAEKLAKRKKPKDRIDARASTTDPDATVMKMADGGFRPAYNIQIVACDERIIACEVTTAGSDMGQLAPQINKVIDTYGKTPNTLLADSGYAKKDDIEELSARGIRCIVPPQKPKTSKRAANQPHHNDSAAVALWREDMGRDETKELYKQRSRCELINAYLKQGSLYQFTVRGLEKVKAAVMWSVIAYNLRLSWAD